MVITKQDHVFLPKTILPIFTVPRVRFSFDVEKKDKLRKELAKLYGNHV